MAARCPTFLPGRPFDVRGLHSILFLAPAFPRPFSPDPRLLFSSNLLCPAKRSRTAHGEPRAKQLIFYRLTNLLGPCLTSVASCFCDNSDAKFIVIHSSVITICVYNTEIPSIHGPLFFFDSFRPLSVPLNDSFRFSIPR